MTKLVIAMIIVGGILLAPPDVLERAKQRNRELEEQERRED
jgi:hypothetical protein